MSLSITDEQVAALLPHLKEAGIDVGVQGEEKPLQAEGLAVDLGQELKLLAQDLGAIVRSEGLFRFRNAYVTVDEDDKNDWMPDMTPERFLSWIQDFVVTEKWNAKVQEMRPCDMTRQLAVNVMSSDRFRKQIPIIKEVLPSCLPVWNKETGKPMLLVGGYNSEFELFVMRDAPKINVNMELSDAVMRYSEMFGGFPWGDDGRSMAAHVAACLGMFCRYLFNDACAVPMFQFSANIEGAGKSLLCRSAIIPIYTMQGFGSTDYSDSDKFKEELNSIALSGSGYLFLDDVSGSLFNPVLNRWVTEATWSFRKFHSQSMIRVDKRCMTFVSDNGCTLSDDLIRRTVIISLNMDESASERDKKLSNHMSDDWLNDPKNRCELLSIWWAMVKHWADTGKKPGPRSIPSFRDWTLTIGGMVHAAGFADAFSPANLLEGGDKRRTEMDQLIKVMVEHLKPEPSALVALTEICAMARLSGLFDYPLGDLALIRVEMDMNPKRFYEMSHLGDGQTLSEADRDYQAARWMDPRRQASPFSKRIKKHLARKFRVDDKCYRLTKQDSRTSMYELSEVIEE